MEVNLIISSSKKILVTFIKKMELHNLLCNSPTEIEKLKIEIIKNRKDWTAFLSLVETYDAYHTYDYHQISKSDNETPILIKYEHLDVLIGIPFLIRYIQNTDYKDITSVYGYTGPVSKGISNNFDNSTFKKEIIAFLKANNFVSAFSRLNPYIPNQSKILDDLGHIVTKGKVVNIDISLNIETQRTNYQNRLKTYINKSRRDCELKKAVTKVDLNEFIEIYHENMKKVNAEDFYFFNDSYFENLYNSKDFETLVLLAIDKQSKKTIAGCLFFITNGIVQYHLSGAKNGFMDKAPTKFLIDEMRIIATSKRYSFFNLGGGLGGRFDDSLFRFKSNFSKDYRDFNLWKFIINKEAYNELVFKTETIEDFGYFPLYRSIK